MNMNRILIVEVNWRGDVLFSTPFIRALRKANPKSDIAALVVGRGYEILKNNPHVNQVILYEGDKGLFGLTGKIKLIRQLKKYNFDTVFLLHRSATRALICRLAGIPKRVGYYRKKRLFLVNYPVSPPREQLHKVDYFLNLAQTLGIPAEGKYCEFFTDNEDENFARGFLKAQEILKGDLIVAVNPGGNWDLKRWPPENFARVCDRLIDKYKAKIVITGAKKDIELAERISSKMKSTPIIAAGKTNLSQLAALLKRVDLLISNDSAPLHIAASQQTKLIAVFGPTSPGITGPRSKADSVVLQKDVGCDVPCYDLSCRQAKCMIAVTVDDVLGACRKLLNR
jgi:heptosyltransferase-2